MSKRKIKRTLVISFSALIFLFIVLCIHIYIMMKPQAADDKTIAMARIDFKQDIKQPDADKITSWFYNQKGVEHVLCNPNSRIAVFTFHPAKVSADAITSNLSSTLHYNAVRHIPDEKELMKGCPVASSSFSYKVYDVMKKIF